MPFMKRQACVLKSDVCAPVFLNDNYNSKGEKVCPGKALRCGLIYVEICVVLISHVGMNGARNFQRLSAWGLEGGWG